jgi:hypothetical protein
MSAAEHPRKISHSKKVFQEILNLHAQAILRDQEEEFLAALQQIWDALLKRPLPPEDAANTFGEQTHSLAHLSLRMCLAAVPPLAVQFGVSKQPQIIEGTESIAIYLIRFFPLFKD